LYSALCTAGSVCSGLSMAFAVYRHRSPVCATAAMDMGSPQLALNRADDELGVTRWAPSRTIASSLPSSPF